MDRGIGWAVEQVRLGARVRRRGWNGKGMFLFLVRLVEAPAVMMPAQDFVVMRTANGTIVPWLCSQTDLLAADWELAEDA